MRTRIKICGITRPEDGIAAVRAGADAIGLVFYPPSPRHVSVDQARAIVREMPAFVSIVGLFVNETSEVVSQVMSSVAIDRLQFHGDEVPAYCESFDRPWIKAIRMADDVSIADELVRYANAYGLLLDTYRKGVPGGTGEKFDWDRIDPKDAGKIILAGGLNPENVTAAVQRVRPYAVDVSGGVEREKGVKDAAKINEFIAGVMRGDNS